MDSFFLPLVAAALAEWGDKTQIFAMLLAARFPRPAPILLGIGAAALLNMAIAAFAGSAVGAMIPPDAALLFLAMGFAFAGVGAFVPLDDPGSAKIGTFGAAATSFIGFLLIELGDKTQFLAAGFGAVTASWMLVACGAAVGVMIGCVPAVLAGQNLADRVALSAIRKWIGALFLLVSSILAINALSLI